MLASVGALALTGFVVPMVFAAPAHAATVTQEDNVAGCIGTVTTPGSENTTKRLIAGDLEPGGTVTFEINYPVDASDVGGDFAITDCVFINDVPVTKYTVSFVPNNTAFLLTFQLVIPADAPIGALYCNYAKTTQSPSASQASNRKANPACFHIGGDLRIIKLGADTGDTPLAGASFDVVCTTGEETVPPVVISGLSGPDGTSVFNGSDAYVASGVADTGIIAIAGPEGTPCTVTETAAPAGYTLPEDPVFNFTIPAATAGQDVETIIDPLQQNETSISTQATSGTVGGELSDVATLSGASSDAGGTITFTLFDNPDCSGDPVFTSTVDVSGSGDYPSGGFAPESFGTYYWIAAYSGDATNLASSGSCGDENETSTLTAAPTTETPTPTPTPTPIAVTGAGPVDDHLGWALGLLLLGGAVAMIGRRRYQRSH